jgi:hypothetical protein
MEINYSYLFFLSFLFKAKGAVNPMYALGDPMYALGGIIPPRSAQGLFESVTPCECE